MWKVADSWLKKSWANLTETLMDFNVIDGFFVQVSRLSSANAWAT